MHSDISLGQLLFSPMINNARTEGQTLIVNASGECALSGKETISTDTTDNMIHSNVWFGRSTMSRVSVIHSLTREGGDGVEAVGWTHFASFRFIA